jgi:hypothetical protein
MTTMPSAPLPLAYSRLRASDRSMSARPNCIDGAVSNGLPAAKSPPGPIWRH